MKAKLFLVLKIVVSLLSLLLVVRTSDLSSVASILSGIQPSFVLVALAVFWIAQVVSSLRCVYIANELGQELKLSTSVHAHFIGLWFNQVLPTSLGGDVLKVVVLTRIMGISMAIRTAILDRFSGLFILILAIVVTLPFYFIIIPPAQSTLLHGLTMLSIGALVATVLVVWSAARLKRYLPPMSLLSKIVVLLSDIWLFHRSRALWRQLWTSTIVHLNGIAAYGLLGLALGFDVNVLVFVLIVPLVFVVALIPVSFAGWGVREAGAIWLFGLVGISRENALVLSVAYGSMLLLAGFPGLVLFIRGKYLDKGA